jgi:hypothetical protein
MLVGRGRRKLQSSREAARSNAAQLGLIFNITAANSIKNISK